MNKKIKTTVVTGAMLLSVAGGVFAYNNAGQFRKTDEQREKIHEIVTEKYGEDFRMFNATEIQKEEISEEVKEKLGLEGFMGKMNPEMRELIEEKYGEDFLGKNLTEEQKEELRNQMREENGYGQGRKNGKHKEFRGQGKGRLMNQ